MKARLLKYLQRRDGLRRVEPPALSGGVEHRVERFRGAREGFPVDLFGVNFDPAAFRDRCACYGRTAFLDIETLGLGDVTIFLVGILTFDPKVGLDSSPTPWPEPELRLDLFMARDPSAEGAMLRQSIEILARSTTWVSFNGRSFDYPRLRNRAFRHGIALPACHRHLDLLILVRRRWKGELPDCRLGTVERRLLGLERSSTDVPGREVPERYNDYVASGENRWVEPVLDHNRRDIAAMVVLLDRLVELDVDFVEAGATQYAAVSGPSRESSQGSGES